MDGVNRRIASEKDLLQFLDEHGFQYQYASHEAVFTCAEAEEKRPHLEGVSTKNLFLCDKKARRFFLVVTSCQKQVDLAALADRLGVSMLRFGSEENLFRLLGITRGAVTILSLVNDADHQVELWMDSQVWDGELFLCHPLVNTATLVLSKDSLIRFLEFTGHTLHTF